MRQVLPPQPPVFDFLEEDKPGKAFIRFTAENGVFRSPFKATFGGFERLGDNSPTLLRTLFEQIETRARELHCSQICITQSPDCYLTEPSLLAQAYTTAGYQIAYTDTNFHIPISSLPYSHLLHSRTAQRVRQMIKQGYTVIIDQEPYLAWYYEMVQNNRHSKGRPLNQSVEAFVFAIKQNPESYLIFKVQNAGNECLAFSVCTLLGNSLYTFYTVNLAEGDILNPLYLLHQQLYNYCQENNISLLDLGIATDKGVENVGLINFKKQLGAIPTKKITWIKYIS